MIVVAGPIRIDPVNREVAIKAANEMMTASRLEEGCISYTITSNLSDSGGFLVFEEWKSQAALDAHFETPHMAAFRAAMGGFGIQSMDVKHYEVSKVGTVG